MATILVVEDEKNLRRLYEKELRSEGHEILLAESGNQALSLLDDKNPDLVVLDIRMPGMDGLEALARILAQRNDLPVILNTAYASYQDNFMSWAADAYVIKSSDLTELKQKIREILDKKGIA